VTNLLQRKPELPTGTVTFLFTDIEGSTRLIQHLGDRYLSVLQEHRRIIEDAAAATGGVTFGTEGDAVFVAFPDARAAIGSAVAAQVAMAAHPWPDGELRVRMGIHTGDVVVAGGDYVGLTVHRVARVTSAAHGGQVLVSESSRSLVAGELPAGVELLDLGEHQLKDMAKPERLFQIVAPDLPATFPPLRTVEINPNNLPPQLTSFVGRGEVSEARRLLAGTRLLTLTGPGGTGKTRIALQLAAEVMDDYPDGVFFVALDALDDPDLVPSAIVHALGVEAGSAPPLDRVVDHLRDKQVLLVLDNFEQVIDAAPAVAKLVSETSKAKVVVTSRIVLRTYGEQEFPVPPLGLPEPWVVAAAELASRSEAVRLFVERAKAASPAFGLTDENAPLIVDIVRRLDGLPLAIELAAARTRILPLAALHARLDQSLSVLTGGGRDRPERQQTLRGAIDWSHDLLDEPDRRLFARFGVFAGGACLTQAEQVCGPVSELGQEVLDGLASLSEKSLLRSLPDADVEPRFAMLATIRVYALERAEADGGLSGIRDRHTLAFLALVQACRTELTGPNRRRWLDRLSLDHDNLRAAFDWALQTGDAATALRLGSGMWRFWQARGHLLEGQARMERALSIADESLPKDVLAEAHGAAGGLAYWLGDTLRIRTHYDAALQFAREAGDPRILAEALYNAGFGRTELGGDGVVYAGGKAYFEQALAVYTALGDKLGVANAHWALGLAATDDRDIDRARRHTEESLRGYQAVDDPFGTGWAHHIVGLIDLVEHKIDAAEANFRAALEIFSAAYDQAAIVILLLDFAAIAREHDDARRYWFLCGASRALQDATGAGLANASIEFLNWRRPDAPSGDPEAEAAWQEGKSIGVDQAIAELQR
jgi:predicted ATPase/class 3 adenylate cyclase